MADSITIKALQDASLDAKSLEEVVNGDEVKQVTTRKGETYPSVKKAVKTMFDNGGLPATPFATKDLMTASALTDGQYAMVTNDTTNNGLYVKTAGTWVKSEYDPLAQARDYADANKLDYSQIEVGYREGSLIGAKTKRYTNFGLSSLLAPVKASAYDALVLTVSGGEVLFIHNDKGNYRGSEGTGYGFFANDPYTDLTQTRIANSERQFTDAKSGIVYRREVVPAGARYLVVNTRRTNSSGTVDIEWAVHKDSFNPSFVAGVEYINSVTGITLQSSPDYAEARYRKTKNKFTGELQTNLRLVGTIVQVTSSENDVISPYISVEFGKYYTISGLNASALRPIYTLVHGTSANFGQSHVKTLATDFAEGVVTVYIDNPDIKYIVFSLTGAEYSSYQQAKNMLVQVEEGQVATQYEPSVTSDLTNTLIRLIGTGSTSTTPTPMPNTSGSKIITQFAQLDKVRDPLYTSLAPVSKDVGPLGITYSLDSPEDSAANNLFAKHDVTSTGTKSIYAHVMKRVGDIKTVGELKSTPFTVPSGSLDNPDGYDYADKYPNYLTVHPSMAYTDTAIGGFKYWMVSSTFPPTTQGGVLWEDEDLFVSNDAKDWQRVRSMYETDKPYTTATLRLPPQSIVTTGSRKNAFLPSPVAGSVFEVSVPADNGGPAVERQNYTVSTTNLPWKHDPYLLIDGGYVYVYHSFNIRFNERNDKKSHFFVCVRTNNGIDWDFVRSDGSTLRITEATSKQVFTKGADGKYNYLSYAYDNSRSSPEVIKFGANDYTLFYGRNFTEKFQSTTPYGFDFSSGTVVKDLGNMNHPTLTVQDGVLYNISNYWVHSSTDRGATWTKLVHYPLWRGGVGGFNYRKSSCVGEGGKFIVADVNRISAQAYEVNTRSVVNDVNTMNIYEYPSFDDFLSKANNGLVDAYIDLQLVKVNIDRKTRQVITIPNISLANAATSGNSALQRIKVADIDLVAGDTIYFYVTLNSRNGAQISFGGFDLV